MRPSPKALLTCAGIAVLCGTLATAGSPAKAQASKKIAAKAFQSVAGPDARILSRSDRYVLNEDGATIHERSVRIQLNTYLAINRLLGETTVDWNPDLETCEVLHNRTVMPSGEVVQAPANAIVDDQPAAAHRNPLWSRLRRKVIVHTGLVPGAVVEMAWRITRRPGEFPGLSVAEPLSFEFPVQERVVEVDVPAALELVLPAGSGATVQEQRGRKICRFQAQDLPALPAEPGAPDRAAMDRYALVSAGPMAKPEAAGAELLRRYEAAGPAPEGALTAARKAAQGEPDRERKLLALLTALRDAVNLSPELGTSQTDARIHKLQEVWNAGWASPLEMASLQARVLSDQGFRAWPALLFEGSQTPEAPRAFALHERAVLLVRMGEGNQDDRLYDPRNPERERPLEQGSAPMHVVVPGNPGDLRLGALPGAWKRSLCVTLSLDEKSRIKGEFALEARGGATPHAALVQDAQKVADRIASGLCEGAKAKSVRVTRLERGCAALSASFEAPLPETNGLGLLSLKLPAYGEALPAAPGAERVAPLALPEPGDDVLVFALTLPKGWRVAAMPPSLRACNDLGEVDVRAEVQTPLLGVQGAECLHFQRRVTFHAAQASPRDAAKVRELVLACVSPAGRELILRVPEGSGKAPVQAP